LEICLSALQRLYLFPSPFSFICHRLVVDICGKDFFCCFMVSLVLSVSLFVIHVIHSLLWLWWRHFVLVAWVCMVWQYVVRL